MGENTPHDHNNHARHTRSTNPPVRARRQAGTGRSDHTLPPKPPRREDSAHLSAGNPASTDGFGKGARRSAGFLLRPAARRHPRSIRWDGPLRDHNHRRPGNRRGPGGRDSRPPYQPVSRSRRVVTLRRRLAAAAVTVQTPWGTASFFAVEPKERAPHPFGRLRTGSIFPHLGLTRVGKQNRSYDQANAASACHSERSEESRVPAYGRRCLAVSDLRFFTPLRFVQNDSAGVVFSSMASGPIVKYLPLSAHLGGRGRSSLSTLNS